MLDLNIYELQTDVGRMNETEMDRTFSVQSLFTYLHIFNVTDIRVFSELVYLFNKVQIIYRNYILRPNVCKDVSNSTVGDILGCLVLSRQKSQTA